LADGAVGPRIGPRHQGRKRLYAPARPGDFLRPVGLPQPAPFTSQPEDRPQRTVRCGLFCSCGVVWGNSSPLFWILGRGMFNLPLRQWNRCRRPPTTDCPAVESGLKQARHAAGPPLSTIQRMVALGFTRLATPQSPLNKTRRRPLARPGCRPAPRCRHARETQHRGRRTVGSIRVRASL
jgi:hypothetical protein